MIGAHLKHWNSEASMFDPWNRILTGTMDHLLFTSPNQYQWKKWRSYVDKFSMAITWLAFFPQIAIRPIDTITRGRQLKLQLKLQQMIQRMSGRACRPSQEATASPANIWLLKRGCIQPEVDDESRGASSAWDELQLGLTWSKSQWPLWQPPPSDVSPKTAYDSIGAMTAAQRLRIGLEHGDDKHHWSPWILNKKTSPEIKLILRVLIHKVDAQRSQAAKRGKVNRWTGPEV